MKKTIATMIFYDWVIEAGDTKRILRIQKFARRERLPVIGDRLEHTSGRDYEVVTSEVEPVLNPRMLPHFELRYFLQFECRTPVKTHEIVALLEAYASYCGIRSRLLFWVEK